MWTLIWMAAAVAVGGLVGYGIGYDAGTTGQFERDCERLERGERLPIHSNVVPMPAWKRRARRHHPSTHRGLADVDAALLGIGLAALVLGASMLFGSGL